MIVVPFSIEEPTKVSWDISVTADANGLCTVTNIRSPSERETGPGRSDGEESKQGCSWTSGLNSRPRIRPISCPRTPRVKDGTHPVYHGDRRSGTAVAQ